MPIVVIGLSHRSCPVSIRERFAFAEARVPAVLENLRQTGIADEAVILSTCNRLEIYAVISPTERGAENMETNFRPLLEYLRRVFAIPIGRVDPFFRRFSGSQTVHHLYQVAAGLDSVAIGETQILGQVSRSLDTALRLGSARHVLSSFFRSAIHAGKRVQSETEIGRHPTSISNIAVQLAESKLGSLTGRKVLVVGSGKMGRHAISALQEDGVHQITLINRTYQHASEMASDLKRLKRDTESGRMVVPASDGSEAAPSATAGRSSSSRHEVSAHVSTAAASSQKRPYGKIAALVATLALAILYDFLDDKNRAGALSEAFMKQVIANLDNDWVLTGTDIDTFLRSKAAT